MSLSIDINNPTAFEEYGAVDKTRIAKDRDTGKHKGFGYVEFFDVETAQKAFTEVRLS